ncbi:MAG: 4Fe-4S binding protein [Ignavibacteriales bacterium]|nr:4Fe-4S binding protein [Ignavibacteriales bacterium]
MSLVAEQEIIVHFSDKGWSDAHRSRSVSKPRIKKIPPERRRVRLGFPAQRTWYQKLIVRLKDDPQFLRTVVQFAFLLLVIWIGVEFHLFVKWGVSNGSEPFFERPPGVEGFLPISALISLKYWLETGIINGVHPSGLFILLAIVATGLFLKKAFCSWLCPIGTLSESLWILGKRIFKKNLTVNRWLDYPLRSLKYLLLLFFVSVILQMDVTALKTFIYSPYNKVADIKMYLFFANIDSFALWTILIFVALSVVIKNFWCRYLCPYGALLGFLSFLSPLKITRNKSTCVDCELCTRACPANIRVHKVGRVWSDECMSCFACVEVCPVKDTLNMKVSKNMRPVPSWVFGGLVAGTFVAITGLAMLAGKWQNEIGKEEYQRRFQQLDSPAYQHNRGSVPDYGPHD